MSIDQVKNLNAGRMGTTGVPVASLETVMTADSKNIAARGVGKATSNLEQAMNDFDKASATIFAASDKLHASADEMSKRAKTAVARAKDVAAQMSDSMLRISKVLGTDFEGRVVQLERLADALERLSALEQKGHLSQVVSALSSPR